MKRFIMAAAAVLLASSGCKPVIIDAIQENPANGPVPSPPGSSGGGTFGPVSAISMRGSDVPHETIYPPEPESEALVLFIATAPLQCAEPVILSSYDIAGPSPSSCSDAPVWELTLSIPPELNRPGAIDLNDPRVGFDYGILLAEDCSGGGGGGHSFMGTLTIVSMDDTSVSFSLSGMQIMAGVSFDGDYVAQRCGEAPVTPPPSRVVAQFGSGLSDNPSSGTGPVADPGALYIFGGTSPGTCAEPVPIVDCTTNRQFVFSLPEPLRVPGVINLDDPQIDAIYSTPATSCGAATFHTGTLEITSIDDSHIAFAIAGTEYTGLNGVYEGAICP